MASPQVVTAALLALVAGAFTVVVEFGLTLMALLFVFWCWAGPMVLGAEAHAVRPSAAPARPGQKPPNAGYVYVKARPVDADRCTRPAELCRTVSRLATQLEDAQQEYKEEVFQRFLTQYAAREKSEYTAHRLCQELDEARARTAHLEQRNAELTRQLAVSEADAAEQRRLVDPQSRATFTSLYEQIETMDMRSVELETALRDEREAHAQTLTRHQQQVKSPAAEVARVKDKSRRRELKRFNEELRASRLLPSPNLTPQRHPDASQTRHWPGCLWQCRRQHRPLPSVSRSERVWKSHAPPVHDMMASPAKGEGMAADHADAFRWLEGVHVKKVQGGGREDLLSLSFEDAIPRPEDTNAWSEDAWVNREAVLDPRIVPSEDARPSRTSTTLKS